jgi:predicted secreted protein
MATKYTKWQLNRPKGHKIYQHLPLQDPPKFTQIGIFGLKIWHLATLFLDE